MSDKPTPSELNSWKNPYEFTDVIETWQQWDDGPRVPALQYNVRPRRWHPRYWWLRITGRSIFHVL